MKGDIQLGLKTDWDKWYSRSCNGTPCKAVSYEKNTPEQLRAYVRQLEASGRDIADLSQDELAAMFLDRPLEPHERLDAYGYMGMLCCDIAYPLLGEAWQQMRVTRASALRRCADELERGQMPCMSAEELTAVVFLEGDQ